MMNSEKIKETKAYQTADKIQQAVIDMRDSKKKIMHSLLLLQNIGLERWEKQSSWMPYVFKAIVKELAAV